MVTKRQVNLLLLALVAVAGGMMVALTMLAPHAMLFLLPFQALATTLLFWRVISQGRRPE